MGGTLPGPVADLNQAAGPVGNRPARLRFAKLGMGLCRANTCRLNERGRQIGRPISSIGRRLNVRSLRIRIRRRHFSVDLILEIGRPLDQDGG